MAPEESGQDKAPVQVAPIPQFYIPVFTIVHSSLDFKIVGFSANCLSDTKPGKDGVRIGVSPALEIALSPGGAKELLNALQSNIEKFEKKFGEIKLPPKE